MTILVLISKKHLITSANNPVPPDCPIAWAYCAHKPATCRKITWFWFLTIYNLKSHRKLLGMSLYFFPPQVRFRRKTSYCCLSPTSFISLPSFQCSTNTWKLWKDWRAEHLGLHRIPWGHCSTRPRWPPSLLQHRFAFEERKLSDFCEARQGFLSRGWRAGSQVLLPLSPCPHTSEMDSQCQQEAELLRPKNQKVLRGLKQDRWSGWEAGAKDLWLSPGVCLRFPGSRMQSPMCGRPRWGSPGKLRQIPNCILWWFWSSRTPCWQRFFAVCELESKLPTGLQEIWRCVQMSTIMIDGRTLEHNQTFFKHHYYFVYNYW